MSKETVFTNARIVLDDEVLHGSILVRDGIIADVSSGGAGLTSNGGAVGEDLDGDYLMPGIVELHTDHLEYHAEPRPGTHWDPVPAVLSHDAQLSAAGITTVFDAVRVGSFEWVADATSYSILLAEGIEHANRAGITRAEHYIHVRCEVSAPTALAEFAQFGGVSSFKLASLMDHTPGQRQYSDVEAFRRYMIGKGRATADELEETIARLRESAEEFSERNRRAIADQAGARGIALAAHDDATQEHVAESAEHGVSISEFPTTLIAARAARAAGQLVVMGAPNIVRGGSQSGNVSAAELLDAGLLDILSSDYVPASPLQAVVQLDADGRYPLARGSQLLSRNPAHAVGLTDRGTIEVGKRADLLRMRVHSMSATPRHPRGRAVPFVRGVYREGARVS